MNGLSPLGRLRGAAVRGHLKRMRPESGGRSESEVVGINCDGGVEKNKNRDREFKKKKNNNISVFSSNVTKAEHLELSFTVLSASSESL